MIYGFVVSIDIAEISPAIFIYYFSFFEKRIAGLQ